MLFGYLTLFTALILSLSAAVYSILGLTAIFAAAFWPIVILGGSLEVGKIVTTLWLHKYWKQAELQYKVYLCSAVAVLMFLTSMGVFGFLSKAHLDQAVPTGDVAAQVVLIDEKIKIERDNIENARALIGQLDGVVNALTTGQDRTGKRKDGSEFTISSAERALTTRRSQSKDRAALTKQIETAQASIIKLQAEKAPIASELRKVEAEVGPIKYIAALVYGDNPDANTLEKAVRWVIILIVAVFDPLAITLLLAATKTFEWERNINLLAPKRKEENTQEQDDDKEVSDWFDHAKERARHWDNHGYIAPAVDHLEPVIENYSEPAAEHEYFEVSKPTYEPDDGPLTDEQWTELTQALQEKEEKVNTEQKKKTILAGLDSMWNRATSVFKKDSEADHAPLETPADSVESENDNTGTDTDEYQDILSTEDAVIDAFDDEEDGTTTAEKEAQRVWKAAHPHDTIKRHRVMYESRQIKELPWNHPDYHPEHEQLSAPPGGDGNLWIPQDGKWINAGPMDRVDLSDLSLVADNVPAGATGELKGFGTSFPATPAKGDMFLRVDQLPTGLYKFNGNIWIAVDKALSDQHAYDEAYIDHLIEKISTGEYDLELLSDAERDSIERRLNGQG